MNEYEGNTTIIKCFIYFQRNWIRWTTLLPLLQQVWLIHEFSILDTIFPKKVHFDLYVKRRVYMVSSCLMQTWRQLIWSEHIKGTVFHHKSVCIEELKFTDIHKTQCFLSPFCNKATMPHRLNFMHTKGAAHLLASTLELPRTLR